MHLKTCLQTGYHLVMLVRVDARLDTEQAQLLLTVHDELDLRVLPEYVDEAVKIIAEDAENILPGTVLPMEFEIGPSWGELKEYAV